MGARKEVCVFSEAIEAAALVVEEKNHRESSGNLALIPPNFGGLYNFHVPTEGQGVYILISSSVIPR